mmetsp:Transcript_9825/g.14427  ORF Transcript_9825/g.14427 Transcript_9825/m.14427 type:complete len:89 (-) Transcript_9825:260-526(-)
MSHGRGSWRHSNTMLASDFDDGVGSRCFVSPNVLASTADVERQAFLLSDIPARGCSLTEGAAVAVAVAVAVPVFRHRRRWRPKTLKMH